MQVASGLQTPGLNIQSKPCIKIIKTRKYTRIFFTYFLPNNHCGSWHIVGNIGHEHRDEERIWDEHQANLHQEEHIEKMLEIELAVSSNLVKLEIQILEVHQAQSLLDLSK